MSHTPKVIVIVCFQCTTKMTSQSGDPSALVNLGMPGYSLPYWPKFLPVSFSWKMCRKYDSRLFGKS